MLRVVRRLYDWVLSWAETPYGVPALFVLAFAEACFFPVPPDVLLMALCLAVPVRSYRFALVATLGSVCGGIAGYAIGWGLWEVVSPYFFAYIPGFTPAGFANVKALFDQYDFWTIFAAGFTPIPYKIFTIASGAFQINFPVFVGASLISRGLRFFIFAVLFFYFGRPARIFIERYFNLLSVLFLGLLIGGFILVKMLS